VKARIILIILGVLALAGAAVYVRRRRAADGSSPVQLGAREGIANDLPGSDPSVPAIQAAAARVRSAFKVAV
jgi:hypothetical protein